MTGSLRVAAETRGTRTVLTELHASGLLRASRPLVRDGEGPRILATMLGPGILRGDRHAIRGRLGAGAALAFGGTSATKVYGGGAESAVSAEWHVGAGAALVLENEPLVAFAGARFRGVTTIALEAGARLAWSELVVYPSESAGVSVDLRTHVRSGDRVLAQDALRIVPEREDLRGRTIGTLLAVHPKADALLGRLDATLGGRDLRIGLDLLASGMLLVRVLGTSAPDVRAVLAEALRAVTQG